MKGILGISAAVLMTAMLSTPVMAQEPAPRGNDIVSAGAPTTDLNMDQYKAFDQFAAEHPDIVKLLRTSPRLVDSRKFVATHSELEQFMKEHPDWRDDFVANPGNYVRPTRHAEKAAERMAKNPH